MAKRKHQDKLDQCLGCSSLATNLVRGLCSKCRSRHRRSLKDIPPPQRAEYERYLISQGLLLPDRRGERTDIKENDAFWQAAQSFLAAESAEEYRKDGK